MIEAVYGFENAKRNMHYSFDKIKADDFIYVAACIIYKFVCQAFDIS